MATSTAIRRVQIGWRLPRLVAAAALAFPVAALGGYTQSAPLQAQAASPAKAAALASLARVPLHFESGSAAGTFVARGTGYGMYLSAAEAQMLLGNPAESVQMGTHAPRVSLDPLRMTLVGANPAARGAGLARQRGVANYLVGARSQWRRGLPTFGQVRYAGVYSGIDLVYRGTGSRLEYSFLLAPGADAGRIRLAFSGARRMGIDRQGNLVLTLRHGTLTEQAPAMYQRTAIGTRRVPGRFALQGNTVRFVVGAYDHRLPLVIDPIISWSDYLGGSNLDLGLGLALDSAGNIFVTGATLSTDFPLSTAGPGTFPPIQGAYGGGSADAFVTKLSPDGKTLIYSTYVGGTGTDVGLGIAVNAQDQPYITGLTNSAGLPTTPNAIQSSCGVAFCAALIVGSADGQSVVYGSYLDGTAPLSVGLGVQVDGAGNAYLTGLTAGTGFPTTPSAFQATNPETTGIAAFVSKINPFAATGPASLVYSTYLGGTKPAGTTTLGDAGLGIAVDAAGNAYVTGFTSSADFPTKNAFQSTNKQTGGTVTAFVSKLNPAASGAASLVYSTFLGGSNGGGLGELGRRIAVDPTGAAYVTGLTTSTDFPTANAFQSTNKDSLLGLSAFVTKLAPSGSSLAYSTYLGGSVADAGLGIAADGTGAAYVTGITLSSDFPVTAGAPQRTLAPGFTGLPGLSSPFQKAFAGVQLPAAVQSLVPSLVAHLSSAIVKAASATPTGADAFVTKLFPSGRALIFSTFLGGNGIDLGNDVAVEADGTAVVSGFTDSTNFPGTTTQPPPFNQLNLGGTGTATDAFVTTLAPAGCTVNGLFTRANNKVAIANVYATSSSVPTGPSISYLTAQIGANTLVVNAPTITCNVLAGTATATGFVRSARGLVQQGDTATAVLSALAGTAPSVTLTVTRGGATVLGPVTLPAYVLSTPLQGAYFFTF